MEFVCLDVNGNSTWFYDADKKAYHRKMEDGTARVIKGEYLPDPFLLSDSRKAIIRQSNPNISEEQLDLMCKPQQATYKIWEHWKNVNSN